MTEYYEDILHNGVVIGQRLVSIPDAPTIEAVPLARADFIRRFTPQQWYDSEQAAKTDADLCYAFALFKSLAEIRLEHPLTVATLDKLVVLGILTDADRLRIVSP